MVDNKKNNETGYLSFYQKESARFNRAFKDSEIEAVKGKLLSLDQPDGGSGIKVLIGKQKGLSAVLAAIGLVKKEKFIGIIEKDGKFTKDKNKLSEVKSEIKGRSFKDSEGNKVNFDADGKLPKNFKINLDESIIYYKHNNKFVDVEENGTLKSKENKKIYTAYEKAYYLSDQEVKQIKNDFERLKQEFRKTTQTKALDERAKTREDKRTQAFRLILGKAGVIFDEFGNNILAGKEFQGIVNKLNPQLSKTRVTTDLTQGKKGRSAGREL